MEDLRQLLKRRDNLHGRKPDKPCGIKRKASELSLSSDTGPAWSVDQKLKYGRTCKALGKGVVCINTYV